MPQQLAFGGAFAGRRILLTGDTGFKGSWLSLWLHTLGARVAGYALPPPTQPSNFEVASVAEVLERHYDADVRDRVALLAALNTSDPDVVLHLAARTTVRDSYVNPIETFSVNVMGTAVLLDALRERGRPCVEDDPMGGADPYSASKGAVELVVAAYRHSFFPPERLSRHGIAVATARAGNVIGGGDWTPDGIVADIMRALRSGVPVPIRSPDAVRPWQHVLEPLAGYLSLASRLLGPDGAEFCSGWNFGPDERETRTVKDLVECMLHEWGAGSWIDLSRPDNPPEAGVLRLSTSKAAARLGWQPRWQTNEAIARTIAWYRRFEADPSTARSACLDDIQAYAGQARLTAGGWT